MIQAGLSQWASNDAPIRRDVEASIYGTGIANGAGRAGRKGLLTLVEAGAWQALVLRVEIAVALGIMPEVVYDIAFGLFAILAQR